MGLLHTNPQVSKAIGEIIYRTENMNEELVQAVYVDSGILAKVNNKNNQVIFGRRGTGKTHLLKMIEKSNGDNICVYIDCRTLGSIQQTKEYKSNINKQYAFLQDLSYLIYQQLLKYNSRENNQKIENELDYLFSLFPSESEYIFKPTLASHKAKSAIAKHRSIGAEINGTALGINAGSDKNTENSFDREVSYEVKPKDFEVVFYDYTTIISNIIEISEKRIYLLFDEWSFITNEYQPIYADLLKRILLPINNLVIKISAIEYQTNFIYTDGHSPIGVELGADIFIAADLDDYYVFRNESKNTSIFASILCNHIRCGLSQEFINETDFNAENMIKYLFQSRNAFYELIIASEGVIRDFLRIFCDTYYDAYSDGKQIALSHIRKSAFKWYNSEKGNNLSDIEYRTLNYIVDYVIGSKRARCFMIEKEYANHRILINLFNNRIIHLLSSSYSSKSSPGKRYYVFALDYGSYIDRMTQKQIDDYTIRARNEKAMEREQKLSGINRSERATLSENTKERQEFKDSILEGITIPITDKRSVRTIILLPDVLRVDFFEDEYKNSEGHYLSKLIASNTDMQYRIIEEVIMNNLTKQSAIELYGISEKDYEKSYINYLDSKRYEDRLNKTFGENRRIEIVKRLFSQELTMTEASRSYHIKESDLQDWIDQYA